MFSLTRVGAFTVSVLCCWMGIPSPSAYGKSLPQKRVAITQIVSHGALDAVRDGARAAIEACAKDKWSVDFQVSNASGNVVVAQQIAQKIAGDDPDVAVAISTLSAQSVKGAVRGRIPLVFAAITDPTSAHLTAPYVTGVTDRPPFKEQLSFVKDVLPALKTLIVFYNPGEDNSRNAIIELEKVAKVEGLTLKSIAVAKAADIPQAVIKGVQGGSGARGAATEQAIFIANDNLIASGFEALMRVALQQKIPVFASDILLVKRGALGMRGADYHDIGVAAGRQVCQILSGVAIKDVPIQDPQELKLYLNLDTAKKLNISFSEALVKQSDYLQGGFKNAK